MSKKEISYNIGDKFVITISEKYEPAGTDNPREDSPSTLYRMNGFKSLVFDAEGLRKLKPYKPLDIEAIRDDAYYNGAREAWESARLICGLPSDGGLSDRELENIFHTTSFSYIMFSHSFAEANDKIKAHFAKKKAEEEKARLEAIQSEGSQTDGDDALKPGDTVRYITSGEIGVVFAKSDGGLIGVVTKSGVHEAEWFELDKVGKNAFEALGLNGVNNDA